MDFVSMPKTEKRKSFPFDKQGIYFETPKFFDGDVNTGNPRPSPRAVVDLLTVRELEIL